MKKHLFVTALAVLFVSGPIFFPVGDALAAEPVIIGVPTSLYTPFGSYGLKAVELAVEEINAQGGVTVGDEKRPFKVVVADTRGGEPGTPVHDALMAYEKLITSEKPHAIVIGAFRSEVLIAAMDLVAKYKVPHLGTIAQTPRFQAQFKSDPAKYKYLFRVTTDALVDANYIAHTLDLLKTDYGLNKILYIYQDTLWAEAFAGLMRKHCGETGWTEVGYEPYAAGASDFSPAFSKAKENQAQVLAMVWDVPLGAGVFAKQYVAMKVPALLIGFIPPMGSPMAVKAVGPEVEYSITVEFPVGATLALAKLPKTGEFLDKFARKYGELPEPPAVNSSAYDAVFVLAQAIERAGSLDPDKLVTALEQTDYRGVSGRIRFDENHVMVFGETSPDETGVCVVFQWQKGSDGQLKRVPVYPAFLAEGPIQLPPWMKK
ncbi:MAG: ABC transporter substrate-binding protein [Desulfobacterales bacterium]|nr:MAG: ABC transporter substrate-binding protein [Desulfobacterales bacterium]